MSQPAPMPRHRGPVASIGRISELSLQTFRQLSRMKVFYFLVIFALIVIGSSMFVLRYNSPEQELKLLKDFSFAGMTMFSALLAIVSTAMLLPRDMEDRTVYTILSKPVPRIEYLLGKLFGVVALVGLSLVLMDALFTLVLYCRQTMMLAEQEAQIFSRGGGPEAEEAMKLISQTIQQNGVTWSLQAAVAAAFIKAAVITALALMISTFASSSLFTMVVAAVVYFAGHLQADMRAYYESLADLGTISKAIAAALALLLPDFQLFNVVDAAVAGEPLGWDVVSHLAGFGSGYMAIYTLVAWYIFQDKEI